MLYENAREMTEYVFLAPREVAKEAAVRLYAPEVDPYFEELMKNADRVFYFNEGPRAEARGGGQGQPKSAEEPDHAGGLHMIWRRRQEAKPIEPSRMVNHRYAELETAKEILAEIFGVQAVEVEEMIHSRLEEGSWVGEQVHLAEYGLWPATFCIEG